MPMITQLAWFGSAASIAGAFLVALGHVQPGFSCFTLGSISWLIVSVSRKDMPQGIMNAVFFVANIIGVYRAFF